MRHITESYNVKLDRADSGKSFDTLDAALEYINSGIKKSESEHFILFDEAGKEMIWLDRYKNEKDEDIGFTVSRHTDKSLEFDSKKQELLVKKVDQDNKTIRSIVMKQAQLLKYFKEAAQFAKMTFVEDKSEPSHIDFDTNTIHYNTGEQLDTAIEKFVQQLRSKKESLEEDMPERYRDYASVYNAPANKTAKDPELSGYIDTIESVLDPIYSKAKSISKSIQHEFKSSHGRCTLYVSKDKVRVELVPGALRINLTADKDWYDWEKYLGHHSYTTAKPGMPLILSVNDKKYSLPKYYTENQHDIIMKDYGKYLGYIAEVVKEGNFEKVVEDALKEELAESWYEELQRINN